MHLTLAAGAQLEAQVFALVLHRALLAEANDSEYIKNLLAGKILTPKGLARLAELLNPDREQT